MLAKSGDDVLWVVDGHHDQVVVLAGELQDNGGIRAMADRGSPSARLAPVPSTALCGTIRSGI
jgi:hypothetical protein